MAQQRLMRQVSAQMVGCFADFALAGQEDEDVARLARITPKLVHAIGDGLVQTIVARFLERPPALLHRKHAARDGDDRRRPLGGGEVLGKAFRIDSGRGDDDFEVRPARQDLAQVAQQEIDVQAALMGLVDDDRVVGFQQRIGLRFRQQDAVGHQLDRGVAAQPVLEPDLVAHHFAERGLQFIGDALGDGGRSDTARLGVADQAALARRRIELASAERQGDLRQLRGLAGAGFTGDDDDLVLAQRGGDLVAARGNRKRFGKGDAKRQGQGGRRCDQVASRR